MMKLVKIVLVIFVIAMVCLSLLLSYSLYQEGKKVRQFWDELNSDNDINAKGLKFGSFVVEPFSDGNCQIFCFFSTMSAQQLSYRGTIRKKSNWLLVNTYRFILPFHFSPDEMTNIIFNNVKVHGDWNEDKTFFEPVFGYERAAKKYYGKSFSQLKPFEIANLMTVSHLGGGAKKRELFLKIRNRYLKSMLQKALVNDGDFQGELNQPILPIE